MINVDAKNEVILGIKLYSIDGALVVEGSNSTTLDISGIEVGLYLLTVETKKGKTSQLVVKQ
jgi:hypothetical protein